MVPSTFFRLRAACCPPVVLAALISADCGAHTSDQPTAYMQGTAQADSAFYLQQVQQSSDGTRINWQLPAIRALVKEGRTGQTVGLFDRLSQESNDTQRREKALLAAEVELVQKDLAGAQNLLAKITLADLEQNQRACYRQVKIGTNRGRSSIDLLCVLIARGPLLGAKEKQQNAGTTWQALSFMTQEQANTLVVNADGSILQGWLGSQRVWSDSRNNPNMMRTGIAGWQKHYPNNPGTKMLPAQSVNVKVLKPASTNKIVLPLLLNGQAVVFGRTIQQGSETMKSIGTQLAMARVVTAPVVDVTEQPQPQTVDGIASPAQISVSDLTGEQPVAQSVPVSTPAASTAVISTPTSPPAGSKIYGTSSQPLSQVLSRVQQDGANIVIGPLLKNNVKELLKSNALLNVLALN